MPIPANTYNPKRLFRPIGDTVPFEVDDASDRVALPDGYDAASRTIRIFNDSTNLVFVAFGGSAVVAAIPTVETPATGLPVAPGRETGFEIADDSAVSHVAAICTSGETATVYVTIGRGL